MSMLALWADIASPWRIGATACEMNPDRPWVGSCRAVTSVILPPDMVTWTSTSPNGFWTTDPVNVPLPFAATGVGAAAWADGLGVGRVPPRVGAGVVAAGPFPALPRSVEAAGATATWPGRPSAEALPAGVLKLNRRASASAVVAIAAMARLGMTILRIRIRSVRNGCGRAARQERSEGQEGPTSSGLDGTVGRRARGRRG